MKAPSERAPLGKYAGGVLELNAKKPRNKRFRGKKRADNGNRTRLSSLGSWRSTDELHLPKCGDRRNPAAFSILA